jgi:DNA-binding transcriptional LysR family regulator
LNQLPLIDLDVSHWQWLHWKDWLLQHDIRFKEQHTNIEFNNIPMLYRAAEEGQRVALGWSLLVKEPLDIGRLVAPFKERIRLPEPWGYYLLLPRSDEMTGVIRMVKNGLLTKRIKSAEIVDTVLEQP